ncbi:MAG: hypothetical protein ACO31H_04125, partial [Bacteroidia bacterium]
PKAGLEPACLATHAPETCVSTNFTTSAGFKGSMDRDAHDSFFMAPWMGNKYTFTAFEIA